MRKPMTIIFIGAIIVVVGGLIGAVGTYLHNKSSSDTSIRIEDGVNKNTGIGEITNEEVIQLKDQVNELLINQSSLKHQLEPFVLFALKKYPQKDASKALALLKEDIENQNFKIDAAYDKVKSLETEVEVAKDMSSPAKLTYFNYKGVQENNRYKLIIVLKPSKAEQLGELEFTVTIINKVDDSQILSITSDAADKDYVNYIFGPELSKISTNNKQAKIKYNPAGATNKITVVVYLNKKSNVKIEGNYDLKPTAIVLK